MVFLSVCLSVAQTRTLWQNEVIICKYINTTPQSDVSISEAKFRGPELGVHPERVCTPVDSEN